jgi:hypothetical protein
VAQDRGAGNGRTDRPVSEKSETVTRSSVHSAYAWRQFLDAIVRSFLRCDTEQQFVESLASFLVEVVEAQDYPGRTWDALDAVARAIRLAWHRTARRYAVGEARRVSEGWRALSDVILRRRSWPSIGGQ